MNSKKLACFQCMGLHSSVGKALQRLRRGHGFESRWSPVKFVFQEFTSSLSQVGIYRLHYLCTQKTARKKKGFFCGKGGSTVLSTKAKDSLRQEHWCKLVLRQRSRFAKPFKQQRLWNSHAGKLFSGIFMVDYYLDVWFLTMSRTYRNIDFYQLHYKQSSKKAGKCKCIF